jgi:large subunit ribosomal protein L29
VNKLAEAIRALNDQDLTKQIDDAQHELFNLRFRLATRQLENSHAIPIARKRLARLKTIQTERRLAGAGS